MSDRSEQNGERESAIKEQSQELTNNKEPPPAVSNSVSTSPNRNHLNSKMNQADNGDTPKGDNEASVDSSSKLTNDVDDKTNSSKQEVDSVSQDDNDEDGEPSIDEADVDDDEDNEGAASSNGVTCHIVGRKPLSGQSCSMRTLLDDGILEAKDRSLTFDYMGTTFIGDLLPNGSIRWVENGQIYGTPGGWVNACRRTINPDQKPPGTAWSIVRYDGKRLDSYKLRWYRKQKKTMPGNFNSTPSSSPSNPSNMSFSNIPSNLKITPTSTLSNPGMGGSYPINLPNLPSQMTAFAQSGGPGSNDMSMFLGQMHPSSSNALPMCSFKKSDLMAFENAVYKDILAQEEKRCSRERNVIDHNFLGNKQSGVPLSVQVKCVPFTSLDRLQPFTVTVSSNALLLIDFHCHLTRGEVVGYLGGTWDLGTHNLAILQAFPCRSRLADRENAPLVEEEIRQALERRNLQVVGWYHSHPTSAAQPTVKDIEAQMEYQISMKGENDSSYTPCVGLISSPYDDPEEFQSGNLIYWVMPPPDFRPYEYGKPMQMLYTLARDSFLTQDLLLEMRLLAHFYMTSPDAINFAEEYNNTAFSFWQKLQISLKPKLPRDLQASEGQSAAEIQVQQQALSHFWAFIKGLIIPAPPSNAPPLDSTNGPNETDDVSASSPLPEGD